MPLTQDEIDFLTAFIIEDHNHGCPTPKHEALADIGFTRTEWAKIYEFKFQWQEQAQIDIYNQEGNDFIVPPDAPIPWASPQNFLRRWDEILPEIMHLAFKKNDTPENYRETLRLRQSFWSDCTLTPFTPQEADFLDALYFEISSHSYGPCLRSVVNNQIHHFHLLELIGRRAVELLDQGLPFPQAPKSSKLACPWLDQQSFDCRFESQISPKVRREPQRPESKTPETIPVVKRSRSIAEAWARRNGYASLEEYFLTPQGSQWKDYEFGP
jgi:hypothetical protein